MATDSMLPCLPAAGRLCLLQLQREDEGDGKVRRWTKPENIIFEYTGTYYFITAAPAKINSVKGSCCEKIFRNSQGISLPIKQQDFIPSFEKMSATLYNWGINTKADELTE